MEYYTEPQRSIPVAGEYDVIVAGAGPAGLGACLAAARAGAETLVVEQFGCLGGMMTAGLHPHLCTLKSASGEELIVGGLAMELCRRGEQKGYGEIVGPNYDYEVEAMKRDLDDWVAEAGVHVLLYTCVSEPIMEEGAVRGLVIESKSGRQALLAHQVSDCTGDADLAARAGVPFQKGREADGLMQPVTLMFRVENCDWRRLRRYLKTDPGCKRMCERAIAAGDMPPFQTQLMGFWYTKQRPRQIAVNFTNITRIDNTNAWDQTHATIEGRKQAETLVRVFRKYLPGGEGIYMVETAQALGVRETRRIGGEYTLTVEDVLSCRTFEDGIARGSFLVDIHHPTETGLFEPRYLPEGGYYDIPYRCLVPREIDNLLVAGRCISVTHEALGSTRVMFQCMALGEAAGIAAAICAAEGIRPRDLDPQRLRARLREVGAIVGDATVPQETHAP